MPDTRAPDRPPRQPSSGRPAQAPARVLAGAAERLRTASRLKTTAWLVGILAALAIAFALRETRMVTMPIAFAFFLAIAVWPVSAAVSARTPRKLGWLGPAAGLLVILLVLGVFVAGLWVAAGQVADRLPAYADDVGEWWGTVSGSGEGEASGQTQGSGGGTQAASGNGSASDGAEGDGSANGGPVESALAGRVGGGTADNVLDRVASYADTILSSAATVAAGIVAILFFTLLMLIEAPTWRGKLHALSRDDHEHGWARSVDAIAQRFRWYLVVRTVLGAITGTLYGLWTWAFGLEFALVWGLLGFLLNYVPTVGSLVAGALPVLFALFTMDIGTALIIAAGLLVIEQVMGNFVDPRLQGRELSLSPLVVLFSVLAWGWIWGIPGALLAVPLTVLITVVFAHVPGLRRIALVLSNEPDFAGLEDRTKPR
ncbi:AI-2E family transporter [Salinarimonas rosea]|uniref:AI-2E family transporter n=1 Tax=Salinarimonas rosea TaxID=552063 RepID=UPI000401BD0E|nr:AI-2E family transporter [Salinarimonas rosea]